MSVSADLNLSWVLQLIATVLLIALGLLHLLKNTASKYFVVDANFDSTHHRKMEVLDEEVCIVCRSPSSKHCSRCKMVKYCSETCQRSHWNSEHKLKCKDLRSSCKDKSVLATSTSQRRKASVISLVPASGSSKILNQSRKILFPYEEFVQLFNWDKPGFPPCGLLNCGNSCFANVILECLVYTKPLVAYILEKGHARECKRNDWCFFCEFERHVERACQSSQPFSPINILSRLPSLGGNLGYGKQEDAHEFMRFAIDTMQLVCLDEFGGEKAVPPNSQETTLIQHIFGGRLQSQVICTQCNNISNQYENMMDLNVEIHGDVASLEECLDQFTAKESLHGDNMYKCDRCNDYVGAWKRLMICRAPNILTIALKRFQRGRFGKLNKRVTFPETLDLRPYTSESTESDDVYKLYAVIVHVDMLNASFFGHYICYIKDFCGQWYRIDDCKVASVDLDEVLSQGAYMLLYSRISARPTSLYPVENLKKEEQDVVKVEEVQPCQNKHVECHATAESLYSGSLLTDMETSTDIAKEAVHLESNSEVSKEEKVDSEASRSDTNGFQDNGRNLTDEKTATSDESAQSLVSLTQPVTSEVDTEVGVYQANSNTDLLRNSTNDLQTNSSGNGDMQCDVSSPISNNGETLDNMITANSSPKHDKVKHSNGLNSSNGGRTGEKLKPLFSPGFLGKRPRNIKQAVKVADEVSKLTLHSGPSGQSNGYLNIPECESSYTAQHEEKPCIENNCSAIVNKQDGN